MRKEVILFFGLILIAGCSVRRPALTTGGAESGSARLAVSDVKELNFTSRPFFIQRADINIVNGKQSQRLISTIRFAQPDSFLISVRTLAGIEAARILLAGDSIFVNDRLNRVLHYGSNQGVKRKYGFDMAFFPALLGDLMTGSRSQANLNCNDGQAVTRVSSEGYIINSFVNCRNKKIEKIEIENEFVKNFISINFDDFEKDGKMIFPRDIKINNFANFDLIEVNIRKVEFNTDSRIGFIPGRNYERVEIR